MFTRDLTRSCMLLVLLNLMIKNQACVDAEAGRQLPRDPRVFAQHYVCRLHGLNAARWHVSQVSDGCRDENQHGLGLKVAGQRVNDRSPLIGDFQHSCLRRKQSFLLQHRQSPRVQGRLGEVRIVFQWQAFG